VILDVNRPTSALPGNVSFYRVDITSTPEIQKVASRIRQEIGKQVCCDGAEDCCVTPRKLQVEVVLLM